MTITTGDSISIPSNTKIFNFSYGVGFITASDVLEATPSKRESKVVVSSVHLESEFKFPWHLFATEKENIRLMSMFGRQTRYTVEQLWEMFTDPNSRKFRQAFGNTSPISPALRFFIDSVESRIKNEYKDFSLVLWSNDTKGTFLKNVTKIDAIHVKPLVKKEQSITIRRQMVVDSIWETTSDIQIETNEENPEYTNMAKGLENHKFGSPSWNALQVRLRSIKQTIPTKSVFLPSGTKFKVTGASTTYVGNGDGLRFPVEITDGDITLNPDIRHYRYGTIVDSKNLHIPYTQIQKHIKPLHVPKDIVYVLKDTKTGVYYKGVTYPHGGYTPVASFSETFSGSKKYKNMAAVKASIMDFTGYHTGLDTDDIHTEWVGHGDKKFELPDSWVAVGIDKTTNNEESIEDVYNWYQNLLRLKTITKNVNGAVRSIYNKIETDDKYQAIVSFEFKADDEDSFDTYEGIEKGQNGLIKDAAASVSEKTAKAVSGRSVAYGVASEDEAVIMLLSYSGKAVCKIYEKATLSEIVPPKSANNLN